MPKEHQQKEEEERESKEQEEVLTDNVSKESQSNVEQEDEVEEEGPSLFSSKETLTMTIDDDDEEEEEEMSVKIFGANHIGFNPMRFRLGDSLGSGTGEGGTTQGIPEAPPFHGFSRFMNFRRFIDDDDEEEDEWVEPTTLEEKRKLYKCGSKFVTLNQIAPYDIYCKEHNIQNVKKKKRLYKPDAQINSKLSLFQGDSTTLEVDAIVNAANSSLMGGGGIDGAIHSAAGYHLRRECSKLNGCETGFTKMTKGYRLPAKYVLHTVGPIYEDEEALTSCYQTCLELVGKNNIKSVAFCCVSTGIFGYPLKKATKIALDTTRKWLEDGENYKKVDRIIFVVFLDRELNTYQKLLPIYFPLPLSPEEQEKEDKEPETDNDQEEESDDEEEESGGGGRFGRFARFSPPADIKDRQQKLKQLLASLGGNWKHYDMDEEEIEEEEDDDDDSDKRYNRFSEEDEDDDNEQGDDGDNPNEKAADFEK